MLLKDSVILEDALKIISNYTNLKSVKKALYNSYILQLKENDTFDPTLINAFCHNIEDPNILVKLLRLKFEYSTTHNSYINGLGPLILFLKNHYTEKQLYRLFRRDLTGNSYFLFRDMVHDFYDNQVVIVEKFKKTSCKVKSLHDEFVRCLREQRFISMQDEKLSYRREEVACCVTINKYCICLPQTAQELFMWGEDLNNCMAGYLEEVLNKETIIYGVFRDNFLVFAVEIEDNIIVQASGKYNSKLTQEQTALLDNWFKIYLVKNEQKVQQVA